MKRTVEDFSCEKCGAFVQGNGYTNHCPHCLWSKHVDDVPGDRASVCAGMMKPTGVVVRQAEIKQVVHICERCGFRRPAPVMLEDHREELIRISVADVNEI